MSKGIKSTVIACTFLLLWGQAGFPNPVTALNTIAGETAAKDSCVAFAKERNVFPNKQIKTARIAILCRRRQHDSDRASPSRRLLAVTT
jgi:hypothetical protein